MPRIYFDSICRRWCCTDWCGRVGYGVDPLSAYVSMLDIRPAA
jgi:hypothetical protein